MQSLRHLGLAGPAPAARSTHPLLEISNTYVRQQIQPSPVQPDAHGLPVYPRLASPYSAQADLAIVHQPDERRFTVPVRRSAVGRLCLHRSTRALHRSLAERNSATCRTQPTNQRRRRKATSMKRFCHAAERTISAEVQLQVTGLARPAAEPTRVTRWRGKVRVSQTIEC